MLRFLWPTTFNDNQSRRARLGRTLHFLGAASAFALLLYVLLGIGAAISQGSEGHWASFAYFLSWALMWLVIAVGVYLAGRGLRYILSDE